jgi:hypothetical protein
MEGLGLGLGLRLGLGLALTPTGIMACFASHAWGLGLRSGCTKPLMQKASSDGVPG